MKGKVFPQIEAWKKAVRGLILIVLLSSLEVKMDDGPLQRKQNIEFSYEPYQPGQDLMETDKESNDTLPPTFPTISLSGIKIPDMKFLENFGLSGFNLSRIQQFCFRGL